MKISLARFLSDRNRDSCLRPWDDTFKSIVALGVASGLGYLHSRHIAHCNITPSQILLDDAFRPVLAGFDNSRYLTDEHSPFPFEGFIPYMAPELLDAQTYDEKIDVYSYAMILYELLTGQKPFGSVKMVFQLQAKVGKGQRPEFPTSVNQNYRTLISRCWVARPDDRPSFREILERPDLMILDSCDREAFAEYQREVAFD
jgi:serine/threonine protein kinase